MERKLAHIEKITEIRPIPGADKIEVATILGWEVIIKKGDFKIGDKVVYVEIDSIMPALPEFEFLKDRKYRIRTIKLRKQISQGICFPLSIMDIKSHYWKEYNYKEGDDVTEDLGVVKYDPQLSKEGSINDNPPKNFIIKFLMRYKLYRKFFTKSGKRGWPPFISKTDEERIQNIPNICVKEAHTEFIETEKLDGQSASYALLKLKRKFWYLKDHYEFFVCSRNIHLKKPDNSSYWRIAKQLNIEKVLHNIMFDTDEYVIIQGEIIGEGIQKNKYQIKGLDFYVFNVIHSWCCKKDDDQTMRYDIDHIIKCVPLINHSSFLMSSIQECVEKSKGKSSLANINREGIVLRNYEKNISFKIINPDFLLQYQDEDEE